MFACSPLSHENVTNAKSTRRRCLNCSLLIFRLMLTKLVKQRFRSKLVHKKGVFCG